MHSDPQQSHQHIHFSGNPEVHNRSYENIVDGVEKKVISAELIVDSEKSSKDAKKLIPVWAFGIEETPEGESTSRYELRVNAETGAIIIQ